MADTGENLQIVGRANAKEADTCDPPMLVMAKMRAPRSISPAFRHACTQ